MKSKDIKLELSLKPVTTFFGRFHTIIFFVAVSAGMAAAIIALITIVNLSSTDAPNASNPVDGSFDQVTIDKINQLGTKPPAPPTGKRISPFVE